MIINFDYYLGILNTILVVNFFSCGPLHQAQNRIQNFVAYALYETPKNEHPQ